jgi:membrane protease YdiL (CAAX protease family)
LVVESSRATARTDATLAPRWHTAVLVALLLAVALTGTLLQHYGAPNAAVRAPAPPAGARFFSQYLPILVVNFGLVLYTCRVFRERNALPALLGERWHNVQRAGVDLALALLGLVVIVGSELISTQLFAVGRNAAISSLLPSTGAERLTWVLVAVSVGFCEEVVYRGYLQTQLAAFTGRASWGVLLQAVLFGIAHFEQGAGAALRIGIYGLLFGIMARSRRSLLPSMACHISVDLLSGLLR